MIKPINELLDTTDIKSILCLNGDLPEKDFFNLDLPIVAADGAANKLVAMDIKPHMIVGDLDSVHPDIKEQHDTEYQANQDSCDYQKSLTYLQDNNLLPALIAGMHGGSLDHIINNINVFIQSGNILYAPPLLGFSISVNEHKTLNLAHNTKLSILGIPHARVTTTGLRWELNNDELTFPGNTSCFNRANEPTITITVHSGTALILIYLQSVDDAGKL